MSSARLFLPPTHCSIIIDRPEDFPRHFEDQLKRSLGDEMIWFRPSEGKTTRALNIYSGKKIGEGHQTFKYIHRQPQIFLKDLLCPPSPFTSLSISSPNIEHTSNATTPVAHQANAITNVMVHPRIHRATRDGNSEIEWVHVVCGIDRATLIAQESTKMREHGFGEDGAKKGWDGRLVWEPLGFSCTPEHLPAFQSIAQHFAVISPNLLEAQSLLSMPPSTCPGPEDVIVAAKALQAALTAKTAEDGQIGPTPIIIIRAGEMGSYTLSPDIASIEAIQRSGATPTEERISPEYLERSPEEPRQSRQGWSGWVPAFWGDDDQDKVVDPTGGGNGFMGGFCAGMLIDQGDLRAACIFASAAASFTIQQRGLPVFTIDSQGRERWNGDDPWRRVRDLAARMDDMERVG